MATLKLSLLYIDGIKIDSKNMPSILVDCDMDNYGYEDTIAQICEQMGDEAFMDYVKKMMT